MNQIKRIIHSTVGKALVISAFALSLLAAASVVVDSQASGFANHRNSYSTTNSGLGLRGHGFVRNNNGVFTTIDAPGASFFTVAFGIGGNGNTVGGYVDSNGRLHGFLGGFRLDPDGFRVIDYPGAQATFAARMNDQGQIVGAYSNEPNTPAFSLHHGFLLDNGVFKPIDFPGARRTQPFGINNLGQIVGEYVDQNGRSHGFLWNNGVFTTIDAPGPAGTSTIAFDINDSGQIVGIPFNVSIIAGNGPAFLRDANGVFTEIKIQGGSEVITYGINNSGQIVGTYIDAAGRDHGFLLNHGVTTNVDVPDATGFTVVYDINDGGQLAGAYDIAGHGYLKDTNGNFSTIDHPAAAGLTGEPIGINNIGQIVGAYIDDAGSFRGFLLDNHVFTNIDVPKAMRSIPSKINDNGQVVGTYLGSDQKFHGFLFDDGGFTDIDCRDALLTAALDVDKNGRIVGFCSDNAGTHGFLRDNSGAFITIDVSINNAISTSITSTNDQGKMTGVYVDGEGRERGFLLDQDVVTPIDFPGADATQPYSINNRGEIVGFYIQGGRPQGFLWVNGSFTMLPNHPGALVYSYAYDIDDLGRIVGLYN
jgi:probable HAF family extracellular repeat protein